MQSRIENVRENLFSQLSNHTGLLLDQKTYDLHFDDQEILHIKKSSYFKIQQKEIDAVDFSLKNLEIIKNQGITYQISTYKESGIDYIFSISFSKQGSELLIQALNQKTKASYSKPLAQEKMSNQCPIRFYEIPIDAIQNDFHALLVCFVQKSEDQTIKEFNSLISKYSNFKQLILNNLNSLCLTLGSSQANLLHAACKKGFAVFAGKMIEFGVDIEASTVSTDLANHNLPPLLVAVNCRHYATVKMLLDKGANFLRCSGNSVSILMQVKDKDICSLIIEKAKEQKLLAKLISYVSNDNKTVIDNAIVKGNVEIIKVLTQLENFQVYINPQITLHHARMASFEYSQHAVFFDELCIKLRKYSQPFVTLTFKDNKNILSEEQTYLKLFKQPMKTRNNKDEALKQAIAQAASLFSNPSECIKYLSFLNAEFNRYYQDTLKTEFPKLNPSTYKFKSIDGVLYPIPTDNFSGIKKEHTLEKILTLIFKPYGLAAASYKWIGFIPHEIADKMVLGGDFVAENAFGAGLFHNLTAHMLQQAMLIYMIQNKAINLEYQERNSSKSISVNEFLQGFITLKVWTETRDNREREAVSFNDPHRLGSIIMCNGHELGLEALADSLIDTFCKGFKKLLTAYQEIYSFQLDKEEFIKKMDDLLSSYFPTPKELIPYAINYEKKQGRKEGFFGETYAAVKRSYETPSNTFSPRLFCASDKRTELALSETYSFDSKP